MKDISLEALGTLWKNQEMHIDRTLDIWESSVLLPLRQGMEGWEILFEVRSSKLNWQPGDICFPGGHREEGDAALRDTAIRETSEELGVPGDLIQVLGPLDYFCAPMGPIIYPFVGIIPSDFPLTVQREEVEEIFTVPLKKLWNITPMEGSMALGTKREGVFPQELQDYRREAWRIHYHYKLYFYPYGKHMIWGITARVLHQFLERAAVLK
jgi:coenzyme A diphosphatase NUDT7